MKQTELPFYYKRSPIVNKFIQISVAIVVIFTVLNIWVDNNRIINQSIEDNFYHVGNEYLAQTSDMISFLIKENKSELIPQYIEQASQTPWIKDIHWYDETGQHQSTIVEGTRINDLYGVSPQTLNRSTLYVPFVKEIRHESLIGYLRLTIKQKEFTEHLLNTQEDSSTLWRIMILLSGGAGFFLTRGFNRFSRQGYRLHKQV